MNTIKSQKEIIEYRKFLYEDEYPDGNVPDDILNPTPLSKEDILKECKFAKEYGFKYFSYCPNCHDSWYGACGIDPLTRVVHLCVTCNYDKVDVYDTDTNQLILPKEEVEDN